MSEVLFSNSSDNSKTGQRVTNNNKRLYSIDVIKFLMACCIICHHFQQLMDITFTNANFYGGVVSFGNCVEFFFIVSGYLTIRGYEANCCRQKMCFKEYFFGKVVRIYPMAVIAVSVTALLELVYYYLTSKWYFDVKVTIWRVFTSLLLCQYGGVVNNGRGIINPLWYLSVLIYSYVVFYITLYFCRRKNINLIYAFAILFLIGQYILNFKVYVPFLDGRGCSSFFFGCFLYKIWSFIQKKICFMVYTLSIIICLLTFLFEYDLYAENQRDVLTYILFPALFWFSLMIENSIVQRKVIISVQAFLGTLGAISYEMYLWHFCGILFIDLLCYMRIVSIIDRRTMVLFLIIMICISWLIYELIEKRLNEFVVRTIKQNGFLDKTNNL